MGSDGFQYRALFEYRRERGDDISLEPGDILTVPKASLLSAECQEGAERSPRGWLHGTNERTKEKGDFPGTFVEYVGPVRVGLPTVKTWPRPVPPTPGGAQTPGATSAAGSCGQVDFPEAPLLPDLAPCVVLRLTEALERKGPESDGLYRMAPGSSGPLELRQALDTDPSSVDLDQYEAGVLADTLRSYLQDLPSSIIPAGIYSELVYTAQETQSIEECGQQLKRILESPSIPQPNHQLLLHLTRHLCRVTQSGALSQASPRMLGLAFGDVLFKHSLSSADVNPEYHVKIIEALVVVGGLVEMQAAPGVIRVTLCSVSPLYFFILLVETVV